MHICFLSQEFPLKGAIHGGIGSFLLTFSSSLIKKGNEVTVIGINGDHFNDTVQEGVRVVTFPKSNAKLIGWWRNFARIEKFINELHEKQPIDIIEGSELSFAFLNRNPTLKYVIRLHGGHHFFAEGENREINRWKGFQEKRSFSKADGFIAVSEYVKMHTAKFLSYHNKPVEVINYPIALEKFYPADPLKVKPNTLVFAGTICEKKGIRQLIEALPIVSETIPDIHLEVFGRDWHFPDGKSYIEFLKEKFSQKELERVTFHGPVSHTQLPTYYEQAEICVFPSHMETQGLVAPEAMAMGKPVIFSNTGPGPETIDHGINGWLCNPKDPKDIASVILEALSQKNNFQKIGEEARRKVLGKFEPVLIADRNLEFYRKIKNS